MREPPADDAPVWRPLILDDVARAAARRRPPLVGVFEGEGVGPEVMQVALGVLAALGSATGAEVEVRNATRLGLTGSPGNLDPGLAGFCRDVFAAGGAILAGPMGGRFVYDLRREFDLFCKLVPVQPMPELDGARRVRARFIAGVDVLIVRENVSGVYFGSARTAAAGGDERVEWSFSYGRREVRRLLDVAARAAARRRGLLTVVAKEGGVPEVTRLWRDCAAEAAAAANVRFELVNADLAAYRLVQHARDFDVIAAPNLLGDMLADLSAVLLGSRGLGHSGNFSSDGAAVYQTNHGAGLDLAGSDSANPAAQVLALAMMLRESFALAREAALIERAVAEVWREGWRTADLAEEGCRTLGTQELGERLVAAVVRLARGAARPRTATVLLPAMAPGFPAEPGSGDRLLHVAPRDAGEARFEVPVGDARAVARGAEAAQAAGESWRDTEPGVRARLLLAWADRIEAARADLVLRLALDVGKPVSQGEAEVTRAVLLLRAAAASASAPSTGSAGVAAVRYLPHGLVGMVTPWNNPLAIPVGKIAPALLHGNAVLWKPAPPASAIALEALRLLEDAGCPPALVTLVCGDASTARALLEEARVAAVTLTGSFAAGRAANAICARRRVPLQAELGGNNAAIVWSDCDLDDAARQVAEAAFGLAGQRCTANRRAIVDERCHDAFLAALRGAMARLQWGDPLDPRTDVGPLISCARRDAVAAVVARAPGSVFRAHETPAPGARAAGAYYPPTIVLCDEPSAEIVQEETFGPVLVVQRAAGFDQALELLNGVRQGLAAALFSRAPDHRARFLREARAGVLKLDRATAGAAVDLPFGGWKDSGLGPPEHGPGDREFYTRAQTVDPGPGVE